MKKKIIIHIIYNLGRGGAETMLVGVLRELKEYKNIVVTLSPIHHFEEELECDQYICLHEPSLLRLPMAVQKLKKIIQEYKPHLVHSHLPQSNFAARLATPASIPLVTTIHTAISAAVDYKKKYIRWLDRFTYNRRPSTIVAVSKQALRDYFSELHLDIEKANATVIHTFVDTNRFSATTTHQAVEEVLLISIGSLRKNKNYDYLIEAFKFLKDQAISLHIYGAGPTLSELQQTIDQAGVKIQLKGQVKNISEILPNYSIFVMPSKFEGFSLSVLEAMAAKRPMLLSDIPSFREQCEDCAIYFNLNDPEDFAKKLIELMADESKMNELGLKGYYRMYHNFTFEHHLKKLKTLYENEIASK